MDWQIKKGYLKVRPRVRYFCRIRRMFRCSFMCISSPFRFKRRWTWRPAVVPMIPVRPVLIQVWLGRRPFSLRFTILPRSLRAWNRQFNKIRLSLDQLVWTKGKTPKNMKMYHFEVPKFTVEPRAVALRFRATVFSTWHWIALDNRGN